MRILVVNDDGIEAAGIIRLAALAKEFGEVCHRESRSGENCS